MRLPLEGVRRTPQFLPRSKGEFFSIRTAFGKERASKL
jgi:hypothetical protein